MLYLGPRPISGSPICKAALTLQVYFSQHQINDFPNYLRQAPP
jgi:hypothetical protein